MKCPRCGKDNPAEVHTCSLPEALALAEYLDDKPDSDGYCRQAAAELRRLYEENVSLTEALKMAHLEYAGCMEDLKEAEKALAPGEPVAWMYFDSDGDAIFGHPNGYRPSDAVPVYAAPQPQPPCKTDPRAPHGFLRNESHNADRYVCECEFWEPEGKPTSQDYFFRKSVIDWEAEAGKQAMRAEEYKVEAEQLREQNLMLDAEAAKDEALLRQALEALERGNWYINQLEMVVYSSDDTGTHEERAKVQSAIAALRERLKP
jgi:hypothetical protein